MATLGSQAVGSIVKLNVNGVSKNFIVVHQGLPGTMYDSSCNGTWLLMEDIYMKRAFDATNNDYENSDIHSYLNNTFVNLFDNDIKSVIKQIELPYTKGTGSGGTLSTGSSGLSTKVFLLSYTELGYIGGKANAEGAVLSYFNGADGSNRIGKLNGIANMWRLRSPNTSNSNAAWNVNTSGGSTSSYAVTYSGGVRPALVLPYDLEVVGGIVIPASGAITGSVNIGGVERELTGKGYININGVLRELSDSSVNIGGTIKSTKG